MRREDQRLDEVEQASVQRGQDGGDVVCIAETQRATSDFRTADWSEQRHSVRVSP